MNEETNNNLESIDNLKNISAALFLYHDPITIEKLREIANVKDLTKEEFENMFVSINYTLTSLGLVLLRDNSKTFEKQELMIAVRSELKEIAKNIKTVELEGELTPAALQVMTIVAYLGGATKSEISFIRGVESGKSIRTLSARGLIKNEAGKYTLTLEAMREMGIENMSDLPEYEKIQKDFKDKLAEALENKE